MLHNLYEIINYTQINLNVKLYNLVIKTNYIQKQFK
jgi:hypothetical protein